MGANLLEWHLFVTDRAQTPGRAPMIDDDTGKVWVCTVGSTDSPTVYSDASGTTLTETHGHALLSLTNGQIRFWTDRTVANLDIYWFGKSTAGMLQDAGNGRHELAGTVNGSPCVAAIPIGNHAVSALSSVGNKAAGPYSTGWTPASNVTVMKAWAFVVSAGENVASGHFAIGTSGLSNAFFSQNTSAISYPGNGVSALGAYSMPYTFSGTEALTFSPSSNTNSAFGALVYMELNYSNQPLD